MTVAQQAYPYDTLWKAGTPRDSEEWRAYCEARECVKRYFKTKASDGEDKARTAFRAYCAGILERRGARAAARVKRLKADFRLIGISEGQAIRAALSTAGGEERRA